MSSIGASAYLAVSGLVKRFGSNEVVGGVDLDVPQGSLFSLLGPSGCGKTTLLMMLAGFIRPDAGSIALAGADITQLAVQRREIAVVFQDYALFPHLTVEQNVSFGLRMRRVDRSAARRDVADILDRVDLPGLGRRYPHQISGGQQQRVALARALVTRPKLLLLDEPLSHLDAKLRKRLGIQIKDIQRDTGVTMVFVTHDLDEAFTLSDHVAIMDGGRFHQIGRPGEMYRHPASQFVANFVGHENVLSGTAQAATSSETVVEADGLSMVLPGEAAIGDQVVFALPAHLIAVNAATTGENEVSLTVRDVVEVGGIRRVHAELPGGQLITAESFTTRSDAATPRLRAGDHATFSWRRDDAILIPSSQPR